MSVTIKKVETDKELLRFIKFPWKIYKNDENWVPPLLFERKKFFNKKKNPFFKHADMQFFMAYKNGKEAGRIGAVKNDLHNEVHKDKVGFFGFFECINDDEVAKKLMDSAAAWLKEKGLTAMRGPANPSSNDEWGMLLKGFDDPPRILMPYNPPYYNDLMEKYGIGKIKDLYAFKIMHDEMMKEDKIPRVAEITKKRYGLNIRQLNLKNFESELEKVKEVYNKAWAPNWGFVPLTDEEIEHMAKDMKSLVDPKLVLFGEIEGKTVGFALVVPDYNYIFKQMNGRLLPFNFLKLFTQNKKIPWARIIILGILPEYQKKGFDAAFYYDILNNAHERGIDLGEASWVLEDNEMMVKSAKTMKGELYKTYRVYEKNI